MYDNPNPELEINCQVSYARTVQSSVVSGRFFRSSSPTAEAVEERILYCQSLALSTRQSSPKRFKTSYSSFNSKTEVINAPIWHLFDDPILARLLFLNIGFSPTSFKKISASFSRGLTALQFLPLLCLIAHKVAGLILRLTRLYFIFFLGYTLKNREVTSTSDEAVFFSNPLVYCRGGFQLNSRWGPGWPSYESSSIRLQWNNGKFRYDLNQVLPCHNTPEELEVSNARIVFYTKQFRKELNAPKY